MEPPPTAGLLYLPIIDADDESGIPAPGSKRRRLRGACDTCRQRKVRCDSANMPGNVCSNCIAFNCQCTHQGYPKSNGFKKSSPGLESSSTEPSPPDSDTYSDKTAPEHVDTILLQSTAYIATRDLRNILLDVARYSRKLEQDLQKYKSQFPSSPGSTALESSPSPSAITNSSTVETVFDSSPDGIMVLCDDLEDLNIVNMTLPRFFGRSSGFYLIEIAQQLKREHDGPSVRQPEPTHRKEFWLSDWEKLPPPPTPVYTFPPKDLLDSLVSIFFTRINIIMGLLHRPTFESSLASGLHLIDHSFGSIVLAVCALASRYSDDPRVILGGTNSKLSSGWEWFQQINPARDFFLARTLHDLQRIFLSILYLQGTGFPEPCWYLVAFGIGKMQDMGIHMRKRYHGDKSSLTFANAIEEELYTRVFWLFVCSDAMISAFIGRPRVTRDDDYDIDYPVECDDEYWDHPDPEKRFQQPEGKPSVAAFIVAYLKLTEILGTAQKTIYSAKRSHRSAEWSQTAVAELDSALNQWLDSIPDHLRWDPHREDEPFSTQSACLITSYYHVQIQIHRSFIPSPMNDAPLSSTFPSLAICANSARSCSHVMDVQARRGVIAHPQAVNALLDSALVILLNVWGAGRTGISVDPRRAANDVQKCVSVLKIYEQNWQSAGKFCDMLFTIGNQLINNPPPPAPSTTLKRNRSSKPSAQDTMPAQAALQDPRNMVGSRRVSAVIQEQQSMADLNYIYPLPISTEELGHLPVYQSFDWGLPLENDRSGSELSFAFDAQQYGSSLDLTSTGGVSDPSQYTQPNSFAGYDGGDWATRDWSTYIDNSDQHASYGF